MRFQHGCGRGFHTWAAGPDESWGEEIPPRKNSTLYTGESGATATGPGEGKEEAQPCTNPTSDARTL